MMLLETKNSPKSNTRFSSGGAYIVALFAANAIRPALVHMLTTICFFPRQCGLLMVAETMSMGILSLPAAVASIGLAPAIVILVGLGILASYTGYVIGQFKYRYPQVSSISDAGAILLGPIGRELFFAGHMLYTIFIMASHILTFTVAFNVITEHGTCSLVFGVVGLVISLGLSLPRQLQKMTWLSLACMLCCQDEST